MGNDARAVSEQVFDLPENELTVGTTAWPDRPLVLQLRDQVTGHYRYQRLSVLDALDVAAAIQQVVSWTPPCCAWCGHTAAEADAFFAAPNGAVRICLPCASDAARQMQQALEEDAA
ncbi:hypothetical protein [Teichococcus aestuarii]